MSFWRRLTWWLLGALAPVMIGHGAYVYWRERSIRIEDVTGELDVYAQIVQRAVEQTQRERGWVDALRLGRALEPRDLSFAADHRFLWIHPPPGAPPLDGAPPEVRALADRGGARLVQLDAPDGRWRAYRVLRGADGGVAAFEVSHDARDVEKSVRDTALGEVLAVLLAALACAVAVALVNRLQVRPVLDRLIAQARRIGKGENDPSSTAGSEDEIALLGDEMNRMEKRINEAHDALSKETAAKLSMAAQLRHADRLATVGRLSAGVAHEFGTPLAVVRGRARLIMDNPEVPENDRSSARVIVEQVDRLSRIIRQLLDLARRRGPPQGPCDLGQLIDRVAHLLEHEANRNQISLAIEEPSSPVLARGDMQQLEQVALNLVINAIQALSPRGGGLVALRCGSEDHVAPPVEPTPSSSVAPSAATVTTPAVPSAASEATSAGTGGPGKRVWFEVEDDGPGIEKEILPVVFEPFVTTKEPGVGTGLGLPLSVSIVQDHGGWIAVHSPPGTGARFRVYLRPHEDSADRRDAG